MRGADLAEMTFHGRPYIADGILYRPRRNGGDDGDDADDGANWQEAPWHGGEQEAQWHGGEQEKEAQWHGGEQEAVGQAHAEASETQKPALCQKASSK